MVETFKIEEKLVALANRLQEQFPSLSSQRKELEQLIVKNELEQSFEFVNFSEIPELSEEYFTVKELVERYTGAFDNYCAGWWLQNIYRVLNEEQVPRLISRNTAYLTGSVEKQYRERFLKNLGKNFEQEEKVGLTEAAEFLGISKKRMNFLRINNVVPCEKKVTVEGFVFVYSTRILHEKRKEIHDALFERFNRKI